MSGRTRRGSAADAPRRRRWCVYLLTCADGTLYAGATNDLARRLDAHGRGKGARYTRARLPVELAWTASAKDRSAALRREAALKRLSRAEKLALVAGARAASRAARRPSGPRKDGGRIPDRSSGTARPGVTRSDSRPKARALGVR